MSTSFSVYFRITKQHTALGTTEMHLDLHNWNIWNLTTFANCHSSRIYSCNNKQWWWFTKKKVKVIVSPVESPVSVLARPVLRNSPNIAVVEAELQYPTNSARTAPTPSATIEIERNDSLHLSPVVKWLNNYLAAPGIFWSANPEWHSIVFFFLRKMLCTRYGSVGTRFLWF